VVGPAFPVGKVRPLEVGAKSSNEIGSKVTEIADERHLLPAAGMAVEAEAELIVADGRQPSDRRATSMKIVKWPRSARTETCA